MRKKKKTKLTAEFWAKDAENRRLMQERIDYHQRKLEEERAAQKQTDSG